MYLDILSHHNTLTTYHITFSTVTISICVCTSHMHCFQFAAESSHSKDLDQYVSLQDTCTMDCMLTTWFRKK